MQLCTIFLYSRSQPKDGLAQLKHVAEWILTNKCCVTVPYMMQNSTFRALSTNKLYTQFPLLNDSALPGMTKHVAKETLYRMYLLFKA
jgi:hypothetical protein